MKPFTAASHAKFFEASTEEAASKTREADASPFAFEVETFTFDVESWTFDAHVCTSNAETRNASVKTFTFDPRALIFDKKARTAEAKPFTSNATPFTHTRKENPHLVSVQAVLTRYEVIVFRPKEDTMTSTNAVHRSIAVLKTVGPVAVLITNARTIVTRMTGNPAFPSPVPALPTVTSAINDLETAETSALQKTKGAVAVRDDKRAALVTLLHQLKGYVQTTADASQETGQAIIQSSGMDVRKTAVRKARTFEAVQTAVSGTVTLRAPAAARRAAYDWQYSTDGGKTWTSVPTTLQAKATVTGLTSGTTVQFRYRPAVKAGGTDWSQPVSLLVK